MNDEITDLAPALLMTVIIALGIVAFEFRAGLLATPAHASAAKAEKTKPERIKAEKADRRLALNDRLYWIR